MKTQKDSFVDLIEVPGRNPLATSELAAQRTSRNSDRCRFVGPWALFALLFLVPSISATGAPIACGEIKPGSITASAQTNFYSFQATSNDMVYITLLLTNGPGIAPYFYLYDPDGNTLPLSDSHTNYAYIGNLRLTNSGTYTIGVLDRTLNQPFDYLLSLTVLGADNLREPGDGDEAIVPGQITRGHISPADFDTFTFSAKSNDMVYITLLLTNGPGSGPYFYLYDPDGNTLPLTDSYTDYAYIANLRLTKSGAYTIGIIDFTLNEALDYLLSLTVLGANNLREPGDGDEAIVPGQITRGHISPADFDTFTFSANSNDVIYITLLLTTGPGSGPYFYLYDPDGNILPLTDTYSYYAYIAGLRLKKSGTYTIGVIDHTLNEALDYNLCAIKVPGPNFADPGEHVDIQPCVPRSGEITPGDFDPYEFYAIAGDTLTLGVRKSSGSGSPLLRLCAPDGTLLAEMSSAAFARIRFECVPQTGNYVASVCDLGLYDIFHYDLSLYRTPIVAPSSGTNQYLAAYTCGGDVVLRWETNAVGYVLETKPDLSATNWLPVNGARWTNAGHFYVCDGPATNRSQFYRLRAN